MLKSEWYTNRTWNGSIDSKFEKYLKQTRDPANKADYMQLQGSLLLDNDQQQVQEVGVALLSRVIEDFSSVHTSVIVAREKLGDFYLKKSDFISAASSFRAVVDYCNQQNSRSGTSTMADLKLAETLLKSNLDEKLQEAYQLVKAYPTDQIKLIENKFYFTSLAAQVCDALHKTDEAKEYAITAIALPRIIKPAIKQQGNTNARNKIPVRILRSLDEIIAAID